MIILMMMIILIIADNVLIRDIIYRIFIIVSGNITTQIAQASCWTDIWQTNTKSFYILQYSMQEITISRQIWPSYLPLQQWQS